MVVIRLARRGAKKKPFYDIVVANKSASRDGKFIEKIGHYNAIAKEGDTHGIKVDLERFDHWVKQGAKPSERVGLLVKNIKKA
ncbi:MAG: 30S ribosomal protein S16 [Gammaproteobacteria bacterium GWF2_41_13]|nr:MAG: 30S ribosomal protein S16 [Gammaproteobacteria bacterium GWF2_41_13]